jgi:uncharacterized membrane protein
MTSWMLWMPVLGLMTGSRSMTPMAVVCWFAYLGDLPVHDTWAFWTGKLAAVIVFTLLAMGEYVADKLPQTPNRTALGPLLVRLTFGGVVGAVVATGLRVPGLDGVLLGVLGALMGTYGGYFARKYTVRWTGLPDWNVAVIEDALTILVSVAALVAIVESNWV